MMYRSLLGLVLVSACTHHRSLVESTDLSTGTRVAARSHTGQEVTAVAVKVPAGMEFHAPGGVLPGGEIESITEVRHIRGAAEGLGIGVGIGAGIGAMIGIIDGDDKCEDNHEGCFLTFTRSEKAILGGMVFGVIGGGIGLLVGAVKGSTFVYSSKSQSSVSLGGPPGSVAGMTVRF